MRFVPFSEDLDLAAKPNEAYALWRHFWFMEQVEDLSRALKRHTAEHPLAMEAFWRRQDSDGLLHLDYRASDGSPMRVRISVERLAT